MKDSEAERIVQIFKDAGMRIEIGETYSVRGQIAQLLNGVETFLGPPKPEKVHISGAGPNLYDQAKISREWAATTPHNAEGNWHDSNFPPPKKEG